MYAYPVSGTMDDETVKADSIESLVSIPTKSVILPLVRKNFPETWIWSDILTRCFVFLISIFSIKNLKDLF